LHYFPDAARKVRFIYRQPKNNKPLKTMQIPFTKYQALGNDFIVIDETQQNYKLTKENFIKIADRHFGVGTDQILILTTQDKIPEKIKNQHCDFFFRIFNADGTEAENSGNGSRVMAQFIRDQNLTTEKEFSLATFACIINAKFENDGQITVDMGQPVTEPDLIPFKSKTKELRYKIGNYVIGAMSIGNPHAVLQVENVEDIDLNSVGHFISTHENFPNDANVNFMEIIDRNTIKLRTYERGSYCETLACGSGSCATVAIGRLWGLLDETVTVKVRHGTLKVNWQNFSVPILLTGPVKKVFSGIIG
jgi:diaminopimelate epimerase